jgi:cysteinyl-tRNA synthetase, unknown class
MWKLGLSLTSLIGLVCALQLTYGVAERDEAPPPAQDVPPAQVSPAQIRPGEIRTWAYQLQKADPAEITQSNYDLIVIDYGFNENNRGTLPREALDKMRVKPDGTRRLILSYLSIGEAETYRYYWRPTWKQYPPEWLGPENPRWRDNFPVQYWHSEWQSILFGGPESYLSRIMDAGFDGVYLDGVDQFEQWQKGRPSAIPDMIDLVSKIAFHARARQGNFLIVPQNGDELLEDQRYLDLINGLGREELFYGERRPGERNPPDTVNESLDRLKRLKQQGKPVLVVEYGLTPDVASSALREIAGHGFVGYMANRALDTLTLPTNECGLRDCSR